MKKDKKMLDLIAQSIFDKKGMNILALDVKNISTLSDYVVIAEGFTEKHLKAIADEIVFNVKTKEKDFPNFIEGGLDQWVVIDYVNIMIHLFIPDMRQKYHLEKLFDNANIIDLNIEVKK